MNYVFFALIAAIAFALGALVEKFAAKHALNSWEKLSIYFLLTYSPIPIIVSPFLGHISLPHDAWINLGLNSLFFVLGVKFFFQGLMSTDVSVATPFYQFQSAAVVILAFIFLGERFPPATYFWLSGIILGAIVVSADEKFTPRSFFKPGIIKLIIANLLFAVSNLEVGLALKTQTIWNILFWTPFFNLLFVGLFILIKRPNLKVQFKQITPFFGSGVFQFIGVASIMIAYQTNLSIPAVLGTLSAPFVFIIAVISSRFFPKLLEHHPPKVYLIRGFGLAIILFAALKLTLG